MKLIVGIDSGVKTAIALIDTSSDFMKVISKKDFTKGEIAETILEHGTPIIITTDVHKVPGKIKKIASSLGAHLFYPYEDLTIKEKRRLISSYRKNNNKAIKFNNRHEKDALSAALFAKGQFFDLFDKIDFVLTKKGLSHLADDVKELIVKGEVNNIENAVKRLVKEKINNAKERLNYGKKEN